jgi:hypothetical protein
LLRRSVEAPSHGSAVQPVGKGVTKLVIRQRASLVRIPDPGEREVACRAREACPHLQALLWPCELEQLEVPGVALGRSVVHA